LRPRSSNCPCCHCWWPTSDPRSSEASMQCSSSHIATSAVMCMGCTATC
jgi:hypothetical protein